MEDKIDRLTIKADRTGIVVYVPEYMSVNNICGELYDKIRDNVNAFQKSGTLYVTFRGRDIDTSEAEEIVSFLNAISMINVSFRIYRDVDHKKEEYTDLNLEENRPVRMNIHSCCRAYRRPDKPYIFRGDIGKKQTLEIRGNVIILGDVAKDAVVISGKSIIVVGRLDGTAIAGKTAGSDSFIMAMRMNPRLVQIGNVRCSAPMIKDDCRSPMIAANDGNSIYITYI